MEQNSVNSSDFWNKMEKNHIENKNFDLEIVLDTLFRVSKALELTFSKFKFLDTQRVINS